MPAKPALSIIVISYNTREMTLECLRSVVAETTLDYELIVLDNASQDGSAEAIRAEFPDVRLIAEDTNYGFALANNMAVPQASADYILLLNPDTVVLDGAIDRLIAFSQKMPEARIWGGRTVFSDGSLNPASCWGRMTLWSLLCRSLGLSRILESSAVFNSEALAGWDRDTIRQVDIVTGCFFLISRADWIALEGFDKTFFMYGEEADLCLRAKEQLGAKPHISPEACIVHYGAASDQVKADKMVRLLSAKVDLVQKHFPAWQRPLAKALVQAWPFFRSLGFFVLAPTSERGRNWRQIWHRRAEWKNGFSGRAS